MYHNDGEGVRIAVGHVLRVWDMCERSRRAHSIGGIYCGLGKKSGWLRIGFEGVTGDIREEFLENIEGTLLARQNIFVSDP